MNEEPILYDMEKTTLYRHKSNSCHFWKPSCFFCGFDANLSMIDIKENSLQARSWLTLSRKTSERQEVTNESSHILSRDITHKKSHQIDKLQWWQKSSIYSCVKTINQFSSFYVRFLSISHVCLSRRSYGLRQSLVNQLTLVSSVARVTQVKIWCISEHKNAHS